MRLAGLLDDRRVHASSLRDRAAVSHFGWWLVLIAVCGLILRVVVVLKGRSEWVAGDGFGYSIQANQMAHGHLFLNPLNGRPDALHPPAWVVVLTAFSWLGGHTWLEQQLFACVLGTATVVLVGLAGRRVGGDRAGLIAAGIAAVYAGLWVYERALLSETLLMPLIALTILLVYRFRQRPSAGLAALLGALLGLLALTRSEQILLYLFLLVPLILALRGIHRRLRLSWLGLATVAMLLVLAPWTLFNLGRFQQPVLLSTGFGNAAEGANCDASYYGANTGWTNFRCAIYGHTTITDPSAIDAQDRRNALTYAEHHLSRVPIVLVAREGRTFGFWSPLQQAVVDSQTRSEFPAAFGSPIHSSSDLWVGNLALVSYWILLVPAVAGAIVLRRRKIPIYPLLAFVATIVIAVAITFGDTRYRAGAEVSIVLLAAIAIDAALGWRRARSATTLQPAEQGSPPDVDAQELTTSLTATAHVPNGAVDPQHESISSSLSRREPKG